MFSFGIIFKSESVTRNAVSKIHGIENHLVDQDGCYDEDGFS